MNIYQKLAKARKMLQDSRLSKSGNGYGFSYFELSDFLPRTTEIFDELGIGSFTSINKERGTMTISDGEGSIVFEVPFGEFKSEEKRKLQPVQEIGGAITYITRYLWVQVMNIVESDTVDRHVGTTAEQSSTSVRRVATPLPPRQSPADSTLDMINQVMERPKVGDRAFIDGHNAVVRQNRTTGEIFYADEDINVKWTKKIP